MELLISPTAKTEIVGEILFGPPPHEITSAGLGSLVLRFEQAVQTVCATPTISFLIPACLLSRQTFEGLITSTLEKSIEQNSQLAIRFMRNSIKAVSAAASIKESEPEGSLRAMRAEAYQVSIKRRYQAIHNVYVEGIDINTAISANYIRFSKATSEDALAAEQIGDLWRQFVEWKLVTGFSVLEAEVMGEHGPWAMSASGHATFAENLLCTGHWMLDCGKRRCGLDDDSLAHINECLSWFSSEIVKPLQELAAEYGKDSQMDVARDLAISEDRGTANPTLEQRANSIICKIREDKLPQCIGLLATSNGGQQKVLTLSVSQALLADAPRLHSTVYRLYRESAPAEDRAKDRSETADLRFNAMRDWLATGRPGLASFIVHELQGLADISQPNAWRTALVLIGEHTDAAELTTSERQDWATLLGQVADSLVNVADFPASQQRVLKSAIRKLVSLSPESGCRLLEIAHTPAMPWDIRHVIFASLVRSWKDNPTALASLPDGTLGRVAAVIETSLNPEIFHGGEVAATALAGVELLQLTGWTKLDELIRCVSQDPTMEAWFRQKLESLSRR